MRREKGRGRLTRQILLKARSMVTMSRMAVTARTARPAAVSPAALCVNCSIEPVTVFATAGGSMFFAMKPSTPRVTSSNTGNAVIRVSAMVSSGTSERSAV
jgi:hypothetical protein